ncbi:hypothetical protein J6350_11290 [Burkholderia pseudomallei]|uniref:hypothetical protein n=1 Tax=Burkholderia pseudomallei TaxID=28450 RepID=UPI001A9CC3EB|nr:hypothetical protein [Burkholderia pseudomallei]MBO2953927.1 hypothetical protein [Burkholderia pseudomallei]MBO3033521.1 hypothetical protein [Burkholderia pseudomallei]MBO3050744.1 hypothetical protein [Burkholderia pseudomallei]MBO7789559.1 hypothetical protein [Burkholderia pseudomallei]MBO7845709.1 hypothetical protein [Burkholderia pseudomallei]
MKYFEHEKWHYEVLEAQVTLRRLRYYATDQSALRHHFEQDWKITGIESDGQLIQERSSESQHGEMFFAGFVNEVDIAIANLTRQSVALIATVVEAALADAFRVVFHRRPAVMKTLEGFAATANLDDMLNASDIGTLRQLLIERAVSWAVTGKFDSIISRLNNATGQSVNSKILVNFKSVLEQRNRIIHEHRKPELSADQIDAMFETGMAMLEELGRVLYKARLPVSDPMYLFSPRPDVLDAPPDESST